MEREFLNSSNPLFLLGGGCGGGGVGDLRVTRWHEHGRTKMPQCKISNISKTHGASLVGTHT